MQTNIQKFTNPLPSIEHILREFDAKNIGIKSIVLSDADKPAIQVYKDENLMKLVAEKGMTSVTGGYSEQMKELNNFLYFHGCRITW